MTAICSLLTATLSGTISKYFLQADKPDAIANNPATAITVRSDDTRANDTTGGEVIYDVTGRQLKDIRKGQIVIIRHGSEIRKVIIK